MLIGMKKLGSVIILAVIFIVGVVFFNKSLNNTTKTHKEEASNYQKQQIIPLDFFSRNPPKKEGSIWTDLASDEEGRMHLVWTTTGSGIFYTVNEPNGLKWKQPVSLPIDASQEDVSTPRLIFSNNQLFLFYGSHLLRLVGTLSKNGEVSWKEMPPLLKSGPYEYEEGSSFNVVSGQEGIVVGVVRRDDSNAGKTTLDVLVGSSDGQSFERKTIFDGQINGYPSKAKPSLVIDRNNIYVLWVDTKQITSQSAQGVISTDYVRSMYYFHSGDFGKTWNQEKLDIGNASSESMITQFTLLQSKGKLFAVFTDGYGTYIVTKEKNGSQWSGPTRLMDRAVSFLTGISGSEPRIFWVDNRFAEMEWWGKTPLVIISDQSPAWINNDVFMLNLEQAAAEPLRLTPHLSSTSDLRVITSDGKTLFMFRFGCAEVYRKSCAVKNDLFIHKIKIGGGGNF